MARNTLIQLHNLNSFFHGHYRQSVYRNHVIGNKLIASYLQSDKNYKLTSPTSYESNSPAQFLHDKLKTVSPLNGLSTYSCFNHFSSSFLHNQCRHFFTYTNSNFTVQNSNTTCKKLKFSSCLSHHQQWVPYSTKGVQQTSSILNNQSALLVKRLPRKKIPKIHDEGKTRQLNNVVAYAIGEDIKLEPLKTILMKQGLYSIGELPIDVNDALHIRGKYNMDQKPKEIFVFGDGSTVFWCVPEVERGAFLKIMMKYCESPYTTALVLAEREELDFTYVREKTTVKGDIVQLQERQPGEDNEKMLELYAFSNAIALSVKLSIWEASLEKFVTSIETVTEDVRHGRKISMSRRQVLKKTGELMSLRHLINLSSDLLDTPDFFWDRAHLEPLYDSLCGQLDITRRTRVINEKLTHCHELVELVSHHLSDEHHIRLEIMIIILIFVEVAFEVVHFVKDYLDLKPAKSVSSENEESNVSSKN